MKAQRRQELRENDLAHYINESVAYLQKNGSRVLMAVVAVAVVVVLGWAFVQSRQKAAAATWAKLSELNAGDVEGLKRALPELKTVAETASTKAAELTALVRTGECGLRLALLTDSDAERQQYTDQAAWALDRLSNRFPDNVLAQGVALCGLATVEENRFAVDGDRSRQDKARAYLEQVRDDARFNATPFKTEALDRLNTLADVFTPVTFAPPLPPPEKEPAAAEETAGTEDASESEDDAGAETAAGENDNGVGENDNALAAPPAPDDPPGGQR